MVQTQKVQKHNTRERSLHCALRSVPASPPQQRPQRRPLGPTFTKFRLEYGFNFYPAFPLLAL